MPQKCKIHKQIDNSKVENVFKTSRRLFSEGILFYKGAINAFRLVCDKDTILNILKQKENNPATLKDMKFMLRKMIGVWDFVQNNYAVFDYLFILQGHLMGEAFYCSMGQKLLMLDDVAKSTKSYSHLTLLPIYI